MEEVKGTIVGKFMEGPIRASRQSLGDERVDPHKTIPCFAKEQVEALRRWSWDGSQVDHFPTGEAGL